MAQDTILADAAAGAPLTDAQAQALLACDDLGALLAAARARRDRAHPAVVTYSPKVFIPLTQLCRDACRYCTFAHAPRELKAPYLSRGGGGRDRRAGGRGRLPRGVVHARRQAGVALPDRAGGAGARSAMRSTIDYLADVAGRVLETTGLLPHVNPGVMSLGRSRAAARRHGVGRADAGKRVGASLRSAAARIMARLTSAPSARLATIRAAGELAVPFTSGILIGIGETRRERIEALLALRDLHADTATCRRSSSRISAPSPARDGRRAGADARGSLWTIARRPPGLRARDEHPGAAQSQSRRPRPAARRRHQRLGRRVAGDPRPRQSRGAVARISKPCGARPRRPARSSRHAWRSIPAMSWSRSAGWRRPCASRSSTTPMPRASRATIDWIAGRVPLAAGRSRLTRSQLAGAGAARRSASARGTARRSCEAEVVRLFAARGREADERSARPADALRRGGQRRAGRLRRQSQHQLHQRLLLPLPVLRLLQGQALARTCAARPYDSISRRSRAATREAWARGATEICLQGGIHPDYTGWTYLEICRAVKQAAPENPRPRLLAARGLAGRAHARDLARRIPRRAEAAPGSARCPAPPPRSWTTRCARVICPDKITTAQWLEVMRDRPSRRACAAPRRSCSATSTSPPLGAASAAHPRAAGETGGFTEFVPLPFVHMEAPIYLKGGARRGPTWREAVLMHAVARLVLHPQITNIQTSWVKMGPARRAGLPAVPARTISAAR